MVYTMRVRAFLGHAGLARAPLLRWACRLFVLCFSKPEKRFPQTLRNDPRVLVCLSKPLCACASALLEVLYILAVLYTRK
jgi:hypothetical protein